MTGSALTPEVHVLLCRGSQVLLLERANTGYEDGKYCVISGHVEPGEPVTAAAIREAQEEVGVVVTESQLVCCHVMQVRTDHARGERVAFFFACDEWQGEPKNMEPAKCGGLLWTETETLPGNTVPYIREAIGNPANRFFSEFGW